MPNEGTMDILIRLEAFKQINGYLGSGLFTGDGKMLGGVTDVSGINFEIAGTLFHDAYLFTNNNSREAGFGYVDQFQIDTEIGIVLGKCIREQDLHFHTILVVSRTANLPMSKFLLNKVCKQLADDQRVHKKE